MQVMFGAELKKRDQCATWVAAARRIVRVADQESARIGAFGLCLLETSLVTLDYLWGKWIDSSHGSIKCFTSSFSQMSVIFLT